MKLHISEVSINYFQNFNLFPINSIEKLKNKKKKKTKNVQK